MRPGWLTAMLLAACTPAEPEAQVEQIPTVLTVSWERSWAGEAWVEYGLDGVLDETTAVQDASSEHAATLYGLKAGRTYSWRAVQARDSGREVEVGTGEIALSPPPEDLMRLDASSYGEVDPGYVLTSQVSPDAAYAVVLDRDGDPVWWHQPEGDLLITSNRPSVDGQSFVYFTQDLNQERDLGAVHEVSLDGSLQRTTRATRGHHDFAQVPSGEVLWISFTTGMARSGDTEVLVAVDQILEAPYAGADPSEARVVFDFFEDWPYALEPGCAHAGIAHFGLEEAMDWTHCNSLLHDERDDSLLLLCKNNDALLRIDRVTGELLWSAGRWVPDLEPTDDDPSFWWSHGHMSHAWDDRVLVFDNAYHSGRESRVVEYAIDPEGGTIDQTWDFPHPNGDFVLILGDARRLSSGNTLIAWSSQGQMVELTPTGEPAWRARSDVGDALGRVRFFESFEDLPPP